MAGEEQRQLPRKYDNTVQFLGALLLFTLLCVALGSLVVMIAVVAVPDDEYYWQSDELINQVEPPAPTDHHQR